MFSVSAIADMYLSVQEVLIRCGFFPYPPIELVYDGLDEESDLNSQGDMV